MTMTRRTGAAPPDPTHVWCRDYNGHIWPIPRTLIRDEFRCPFCNRKAILITQSALEAAYGYVVEE